MASLAGVYLFCLGLASGLTLLTITGYRRVSPRWLKWVLVASGLFVMSRYVTMAIFTRADAPQHFWMLRRCWWATSVGLTLPSVFAIDQLVRHPALSPNKILRWFAPFLLVYALVILVGSSHPVPDRVIGWMPRLEGGWRFLLALTQSAFVVTFVGFCVLLIRKLPSAPIRLPLFWLAVGHLTLALDGLLVASGRWYFRPFLFSEMLTLLAIWHAYETSASS